MSDCSSDIRSRRKHVDVGNVAVFAHVEPSKEQALKPLEEAAEAFGAWQLYDKRTRMDEATGIRSPQASELRDALLDECADVVQAVCNLAASLGVRDMTDRMRECRLRNEKRGRM